MFKHDHYIDWDEANIPTLESSYWRQRVQEAISLKNFRLWSYSRQHLVLLTRALHITTPIFHPAPHHFHPTICKTFLIQPFLFILSIVHSADEGSQAKMFYDV